MNFERTSTAPHSSSDEDGGRVFSPDGEVRMLDNTVSELNVRRQNSSEERIADTSFGERREERKDEADETDEREDNDNEELTAEVEAFKRRHLMPAQPPRVSPAAERVATTATTSMALTIATTPLSPSSPSPHRPRLAASDKNRPEIALSPTVQKLAEETQRRADAADAAEAKRKGDSSDDDDDDYYYDDINFFGGENADTISDAGLTLEYAEKVFRDITARCNDEDSDDDYEEREEEASQSHNHRKKPSPVRAAAACLLLEQLCALYPQYVTILTAISDVIMRSIYVPDTLEMRQLLGSVRRKRFTVRVKKERGEEDGVLSGRRGDVHYEQQPLPTDLRQKYGRLLKPYARKTYAEAHEQLREGLIAHARVNRNIELRLSKQTSIFERTVKHWSSSVLRNHFVVWRQHTRRRKQIREKYRTIFGRMRNDESRVKALRAWRDRAAKVKRLALFDSTSIAELDSIQASTSKLQEQINALNNQNSDLGAQIIDLERDRQVLQSQISAKERVVVELSLRVRDMGRVGTQLLDGAIVRRPPPQGSDPIEVLVEWASQMIDAAGGAIDGQRDILRALRDAGDSASAPQSGLSPTSNTRGGVGSGNNANDGHAFGQSGSTAAAPVNISLPALGIVMLGFTDERAPSREQIIHLHTLKEAKSVAKELVAMCTRLISAPSLVTSDQLLTRQRPMILLFLASLFRHYTNYILNKPLPSIGGELPSISPFAAAGAAFAASLPAGQTCVSSSGASGTSSAMRVGENTSSNRHSSSGAEADDEKDPEAAAAETVGQWADRVVYQQQWITTSMASLHAALDLALEKPIQLSSEEQEDLGKFFSVPMRKLSDVLPNGVDDTFYVTFFRSLTRVYPDLRKVYSAYATPTLSYHDLVRLLKDCKLIGGPRRFQRSQVVLLMLNVLGFDPERFGSRRGAARATNAATYALHTASSAAASASGVASTAAVSASAATKPSIMDYVTAEDCNQLELSPAAFTETVIRLALAYTRKAQQNNSILLTTSSIVVNFVIENIVPNALRSDVDRFKHAFRHPLVQAVIARHKINLRRAFHLYAKEENGEGMAVASLIQMGRDCRWYTNKHITDDVLAEVFKRCQQDNGGSYATLDLYEWLEVVCALAIYDCPTPLIPLHSKLAPFVEDRILSILGI